MPRDTYASGEFTRVMLVRSRDGWQILVPRRGAMGDYGDLVYTISACHVYGLNSAFRIY